MSENDKGNNLNMLIDRSNEKFPSFDEGDTNVDGYFNIIIIKYIYKKKIFF